MLLHLKAPFMNKKILCYGIIDEQSDTSFADPQVFEKFKLKSKVINYSIKSAGGISYHSGRVAKGLTVKGVGQTQAYKLRPLYECNLIPNSKDEIATPSNVINIPSISQFSDKFNHLNDKADVLLLLGRDNPEIIATKTHSSIAPIVHETPLGWALVGESGPSQMGDSATTLCIREHMTCEHTFPKLQGWGMMPEQGSCFQEFKDDELLGLSKNDEEFLDILKEGMVINDKGQVQCPLPFKNRCDPVMPDNKQAAYHRTSKMLKKLASKPYLESILDTMRFSISEGHVEKVPEDELEISDGKGWYLPIFVVEHPRKKPRMVFDSAASYQGTSLNSKLLSGPDEANKLRDVLLRFREREVAYAADVQAMYHMFKTISSHKDYLRFFYWEDNDPTKRIIQYRACVHIFGNTSSPSVANRGFRFTIDQEKIQPTKQVENYIRSGFYIDDGLGSADTIEEAISTIQGTKNLLSKYGIRLHKIVSSEKAVIEAFPPSERGEIKIMDFDRPDEYSMSKTLGISWDVNGDYFVINVNLPQREFTRRGCLSIQNSVYDVLGVTISVTLIGKLFMRKILPAKSQNAESSQAVDWDTPLDSSLKKEFEEYKQLLYQLSKLKLPRGFIPKGFGKVISTSMHCFGDSSEYSIGYVIYLRSVNENGRVHVAFVTAGNKVTPKSATSLPRLELCASLETANAGISIYNAFERKPDSCHFYTDSKVVIGYMENQEKRFARYITRRVNLISKVSKKWKYVESSQNVGDIASRISTPSALLNSRWLSGPKFLWESELPNDETVDMSDIELPEQISETKSLVTRKSEGIFDSAFTKYGDWNVLQRIAERVHLIANKFLKTANKQLKCSSMELLIKDAQMQKFSDIISTLKRGESLTESHTFEPLAPVLDKNGLLRVGGRLDRLKEPFDRKHPYLIPQNHPISQSIMFFFHSKGGHQGRHITHGIIRENGFHLENGRRLIRQMLRDCFICKRLRAKLQTQFMSDLPEDRLTLLSTTAAFTNSGMDLCGPFKLQRGKATRANSGTQKIWLLLFTCLNSRACHVLILQSLETAALKLALIKFLSLRGACRRLRSDQGTNFIGAAAENEKVDLDLNSLKNDMKKRQVEWIFNPPQSSHFGGVWERKIGAFKRVLEGTLVLLGPRLLTYDEFEAYAFEACSIVNSTPLWEVSEDPNDMQPLTPAMLLTLKDNPHPPPPEQFSKEDLLAYGKARWRRVQYLSEQFWVRWRRGYLDSLQERSKWTKKRANLKENDIVLLRDKNAKRNCWPMARISRVKYSKDGFVRSCDVQVKKKTSKGTEKTYTYNRPISELVLLSTS